MAIFITMCAYICEINKKPRGISVRGKNSCETPQCRRRGACAADSSSSGAGGEPGVSLH